MDDDWGEDFGATTTTAEPSRGYGGGGGGRGGGGGDNACFRCKEVGHMSRECPNNTGGGGGGNCYKCNQSGHMARDCPNEDTRERKAPGACFKCGEEGHMSRDCPNQGSGDGGRRGGAGGGGGACFKCGEEGHMSRECPTGGSGGGGGGGNCYKCQQPGHMARDCTEEAVDGEERPRRGGGDGGCFRCKEQGHMAKDCPNAEANGGLSVGPDGKERERYDPPEMLEGDDVFRERNETHSGSGINFDQYDKIPVNVTGDNCPAPIASFSALGLRPLLLENLGKCGYTRPTPIQRTASPMIMAGRDVMACAQTGSGKTAGFLLPILNKLLQDDDLTPTCTKPSTPECLILAPTRELAIQIGKESHTYANGSIIRTRVVYGGTTIFAQRNQLNNGCNVLVATPGRLNQFINEGHVSLSNVKYFILDEADRMLDMGFMPDVQKIVDKLPPKGQRVSGMFSATFPTAIQQTANNILENYIFITVGIVGGACKDVEQTFIETERSEKRNKLMDILKTTDDTDKVLIFCASKKGADFLASSLSNAKLSSTSIHGDRLQSQRETALREFTTGVRKILVATAVAARGLDIPKVSLVINYDLPSEIDEYVHRIGRTGRVGNVGRAISFYDAGNDSAIAPQLVGILKDAGQPVPDWMESLGSAGLDGFGAQDARDGLAAGGGEEEDEDW